MKDRFIHMKYWPRKRLRKDLFARTVMRSSIIFIHALAFTIFIGLLLKSSPILSCVSLPELLFSSAWHPMEGEFGLFPFIVSTLEVTVMAMVMSIPLYDSALMSAALILMIPIMICAMEESIRMVPFELREISYALGTTKIETTLAVVFRQAFPEICTAVILTFGRGIGDAASILMD